MTPITSETKPGLDFFLVNEEQIAEFIVLDELIQAGVEDVDLVRDVLATEVSKHRGGRNLITTSRIFDKARDTSTKSEQKDALRRLYGLCFAAGTLAMAVNECGRYGSDSPEGQNALNLASLCISLASVDFTRTEQDIMLTMVQTTWRTN